VCSTIERRPLTKPTTNKTMATTSSTCTNAPMVYVPTIPRWSLCRHEQRPSRQRCERGVVKSLVDSVEVIDQPHCETKMAVRLFLASGGQRTIADADSAHADDAFFVVTRHDRNTGRVDTLLTLRSIDVVTAEIVRNGITIERVRGRGEPST